MLWPWRGAWRALQPPPSDGPVIVGERPALRFFNLERFGAAFDFSGDSRRDRVVDAAGGRTDRQTTLRETLELSGQGNFGHKNLLDVSGTVQFGFQDRWLDSETAGQRSHEHDVLTLYDVRGLILGASQAPTTLYARREQSLLDRAFAGNIDNTLTEFGVISQIRSERAPTTLQLFHREQEQTDQIGLTDSLVRQDTFTAQSSIRLADAQRLDVDYTFDRVDERVGAAFDDQYDRHDANIVHTLTFGPDARQHELRSSLRVYDQGGRFAQSDLRWDELLVLRHTERLETRYTAGVSQQERSGESQRLYRAEASVRHRLFESLVSTAAVGVRRLDAPEGFTSDDVYVNGLVDYTKRVPLGRLDLAASAAYDAQSNSERGTTVGVINEPGTFNDPNPIVLPRRNVVAGSIVVTPPSGFPPYVEGVDYTVRVFPDRTELRVIPGGAIVDGQSLLVSYDVGPEPANDIDTTSTSVSARYTLTEGALHGVGVYASFRTLDQSVDTRDPSLVIVEDARDLLLGVEFVRAGFDIRLEHERRTSNTSPFDADRLLASYVAALGPGSALSAEWSHESIDYPLEDDHVEFDRLTGRWTQRLDASFDFNLRLEYRNERSDQRGDSEGFEQIAGFTFRKGQTTIFASFRNSSLDSADSETASQAIEFGLRRSF
ncbi:MAG: hypothetical protein JNM80_07320 [Phycisphaerae bacterium]|nr:hypothetical protein [Phycisphaerae bacterium]